MGGETFQLRNSIGLQMMTAKLLQNSIELLVSMMRRGREDMRQKKRMISETGGKLEAAMETEQFKALRSFQLDYSQKSRSVF